MALYLHIAERKNVREKSNIYKGLALGVSALTLFARFFNHFAARSGFSLLRGLCLRFGAVLSMYASGPPALMISRIRRKHFEHLVPVAISTPHSTQYFRARNSDARSFLGFFGANFFIGLFSS